MANKFVDRQLVAHLRGRRALLKAGPAGAVGGRADARP